MVNGRSPTSKTAVHVLVTQFNDWGSCFSFCLFQPEIMSNFIYNTLQCLVQIPNIHNKNKQY